MKVHSGEDEIKRALITCGMGGVVAAEYKGLD